MKKISGILCLLLIAFVFVVTGINPTKAIASTVTINRDDSEPFVYVNDATNHTGEWQRLVSSTDSNAIFYCYDGSPKNWPESGTLMNLTNADSEIDEGLTYILQNGYPNKTITDNTDIDRYITQGAIWLYVAGTSTWTGTFATGTESQAGIRDAMEALAAAARSYSGDNSAISLSVSDSNMILSSDKTYYESVAMMPTLSGSTYTVSLTGAPSGASVRTTSGETKSGNIFNSGESFVVRVPASSITSTTTNLTVNVSTSATVKKAYIYAPDSSVTNADEIQRVVTLGDYTTTVSSSARLTVSKDVVCVDYKIIGNVIPKAELTDPTPDSTCFDKGNPYDQEDELTTRQTGCKFNGWFTKDDLTGKWVDGTALNNNMTLYGAWECSNVIEVPPTAASSSLKIVGAGFVAIAGGVGYYVFKNKKVSKI